MHEVSLTETVKDTEECSQSITVDDLAQSVLTLHEVVQLFDVGSPTFNIKLHDEEDVRTVVLTKTMVEVDGRDKVIVMIRDVSDRTRLEEEHKKKKVEKDRTFMV